MSFREPPRRFHLTPLPHELDRRPVEIPEPTLLERLRQRGAERPPPTTRGAAFLFILPRVVIGIFAGVGATLLIALAGGWLRDGALSKTFYIVGALALLPLVGWGSGGRARRGLMVRSRTPPFAVLPVGLALIGIGVLIDSLR